MKNNKGLTLVELLITVVILALVIIGAATFMLTGSRSFAKGSADSSVQNEAELAVNQIEDLVIDVNGGINFEPDALGNDSLIMFHTEPDDSGVAVYKKRTVTWNDDKLYSSEWLVDKDPSGAYVETSTVYSDQLLAENVTNFDVDVSDTIQETGSDGSTIEYVRSVVISVNCLDGTGKASYATTPRITLRNRMLLSSNPGNIFDNTPTADDNLALYISGTGLEGAVPIVDRVTTVERGKTYNIFAMVNASTNVNSICDWELTDEESGHLSVLPVNGAFVSLDVSDSEPCQYLIITASYKSNSSKKAVGIVKVIGDDNAALACNIIPYDMSVDYQPYYKSTISVCDGYSPQELNNLQYKWSVSDESKVEPFASTNKDLKLIISEEETGKVLTIYLQVYSPDKNQYAYDSIDYLIGGDSRLERGKTGYSHTSSGNDGKTTGYHSDNWYYFDLPTGGGDNKCSIVGHELYVCDITGNRISSKSYLIDYFILDLNGGYTEMWGGNRVNYWLTISEDMPPHEEFYVKIVINFRFSDGTDWNYERIHFVSGVHLYGENAVHGAPNFSNNYDITFFYNVIGFYSLVWDDQPYIFDYEVDFDYTAPTGVTLEAKKTPPHTNVDSGGGEGSKLMRAGLGYNVINESGTTINPATDIKIRSAKIKVYMVENPDIYTYCYITYDY